MSWTLTRRDLTKSALAAVPLVAVRTGPARAAEFTYKFANNLPATHPLNIRGNEAAGRILEATGGRVEIKLFPSSQLGADTDALAQLRSGALEFFTMSGLILSTLVPAAAINGIGFAFKSYDQVWAAMDGKLGAHVRAEIAKREFFALDHIWDNGFRQATNSVKPIVSPDDFAGLKMRVPVSALWTSMFRALGASPVSLNMSEVYSALQTHVADGQENPLAIIDTVKLYEVQKYCSLTNHMWDGYWLLVNRRAFERLPGDAQEIVARELNRGAVEERADVAKLNAELGPKLQGLGMAVNTVEPAPFRQKLIAAGFYKDWRTKFGDTAWNLLTESAEGLP